MARTEVRPFRVNVPEEDLVDLRRRIAATRWPDRETVPDRSQGAQLAELQELVRYWGMDYSWAAQKTDEITLLVAITAFPNDDLYRPPETGARRASPTSSTSTRRSGADTSRPGRSPTSSRRRFARRSDPCAS